MSTNIVATRDDHRRELYTEIEAELLTMLTKANGQASQSMYRDGVADGIGRALVHVQRMKGNETKS